MAVQHNVALVGMKSRTEKARIGIEVVGFMDINQKFIVTCHVETVDIPDKNSITLKTAKGEYTLQKHASANRYEGTCDGIKVHVCLKKVSGNLIYWVK